MPTVEDIIVEPPEAEAADGPDVPVVDPMAWYDSPGPFELEIGCGKGGFLLCRARAAPESRILGIEWASKYFRYCADRMARRGVTNVRVMRADARDFVTRNLPPQCLAALYLFHPDPWPKKRHHKRRLVQPPFVEAAVRCLRPGGNWFIQSDHAEYFGHIRSLLDDHAGLLEIPWAPGADAPDVDWSGTNFEIKYAREGRPIHRVAYQRR